MHCIAQTDNIVTIVLLLIVCFATKKKLIIHSISHILFDSHGTKSYFDVAHELG